MVYFAAGKLGLMLAFVNVRLSSIAAPAARSGTVSFQASPRSSVSGPLPPPAGGYTVMIS